jgi:hypothetical protein
LTIFNFSNLNMLHSCLDLFRSRLIASPAYWQSHFLARQLQKCIYTYLWCFIMFILAFIWFTRWDWWGIHWGEGLVELGGPIIRGSHIQHLSSPGMGGVYIPTLRGQYSMVILWSILQKQHFLTNSITMLHS